MYPDALQLTAMRADMVELLNLAATQGETATISRVVAGTFGAVASGVPCLVGAVTPRRSRNNEEFNTDISLYVITLLYTQGMKQQDQVVHRSRTYEVVDFLDDETPLLFVAVYGKRMTP